MSQQISGYIAAVGECREYTSQSGNVFYRRTIVIETLEEQAQGVALSLSGDLAQQFSLPIGTQVQAYYAFRLFYTRETRQPCTEVRCFRVDMIPGAERVYVPSAQPPPSPVPSLNPTPNQLPF